MEEPPRIRYAKTGDSNIAYQVFGEGPLAIVYVPGLLNHIETTWATPAFARYCRRLAGFARVVLFDKLGTGLSDRLPPGEQSTLERRVEDVLAVMDAAGLQRAALLGTADGGPPAAMFAATYPLRTTALILYGTWARLAVAPDHPIGFPTPVLDESLRTVELLWGNDAAPLMLSRLAPALSADPQWRRSVARMERLAASPGAAVTLHRIIFATDIRALLPSIRVPTLVLHTSRDRLVPLAHGRDVAQRIAGARLVELEGASHFFFHETGDLVADLIQEFLTGTRPEPAAERVLTTILFADIVESTQKAAELGDRRWADVLSEYHERARLEVARHRGREVDAAGDGFFATFSGPARAVSCAAAIRESVRTLGLEIRSGIHTGEVESREHRVAGMAVHIGARVAALAQPGEILVSSTVKDLVVGSGIEFTDRGTQALKGVPAPWHVFAAQV